MKTIQKIHKIQLENRFIHRKNEKSDNGAISCPQGMLKSSHLPLFIIPVTNSPHLNAVLLVCLPDLIFFVSRVFTSTGVHKMLLPPGTHYLSNVELYLKQFVSWMISKCQLWCHQKCHVWHSVFGYANVLTTMLWQQQVKGING